MSLNAFQLKGSLEKNGYDWWWHSLTARKKTTNEEKAFFIEYYVINPSLMSKEPLWGQREENKIEARNPAYAMIKAGCWGNDAVQIHNFYGKDEFYSSDSVMDVKIGSCTANESHLQGSVFLSEEECLEHPEFLCGSGSMTWDLKAVKTLSYNVGYGASSFFRKLKAFSMFWHVEGMKTEYQGTITFNGEEYIVSPQDSYGYQDKNWGKDYTNPWIWLNCNNFKDSKGQSLELTSLDIGGGSPVAFGITIKRKMLIAFYYQGKLYEFNFSKFWKYNKQAFDCPVEDDFVYWNVWAETARNRIEVNFKCSKNEMLLVNYENPRGEKKHNNLYNGGTAYGEVKLYEKKKKELILIETFTGKNGGCEYGEY